MEIVKEKALKICHDFLGGIWKTVPIEKFIIEPVYGGVSNYLYKCSLSPELFTGKEESLTVLLRFYIRLLECDPTALVTETVIFTLLSERKLGPKLYGVFEGGRLEEFIPSRPLCTNELFQFKYSSVIARKLAQIHAITAPVNKEPTWMFNTMDSWLENIHCNTVFYHMKNFDLQTKMQKLLSYPLYSEAIWIKNLIVSCNSPVVFCHNDLQENNILVLESDQLIFIDFEYCCYNFRGFDFGNHFCEYCFDYTYPEKPYYKAEFSKFPSEEQQLEFIHIYLDEYDKIGNNNVTDNVCDQELLNEVKCFALLSHFFWGLWSICMSVISDIDFDYLDYGLMRFKAYFEGKKRHFISENK